MVKSDISANLQRLSESNDVPVEPLSMFIICIQIYNYHFRVPFFVPKHLTFSTIIVTEY